MPNENRPYISVARGLHWLMAVIILLSAMLGLYGALGLSYGVSAGETAWKAQVITLHKDLASTLLFLIVVRVLWRLTHRPPLLPGMPVLWACAVHFGYFLLYVLMVLDPITGWANSSASGHPVAVLGLLHIPPLVVKNEEMAPTVSLIHKWTSYSLLIVIAVHVLFALKRRLLGKAGTLQAMLPGRAGRQAARRG